MFFKESDYWVGDERLAIRAGGRIALLMFDDEVIIKIKDIKGIYPREIKGIRIDQIELIRDFAEEHINYSNKEAYVASTMYEPHLISKEICLKEDKYHIFDIELNYDNRTNDFELRSYNNDDCEYTSPATTLEQLDLIVEEAKKMKKAEDELEIATEYALKLGCYYDNKIVLPLYDLLNIVEAIQIVSKHNTTENVERSRARLNNIFNANIKVVDGKFGILEKIHNISSILDEEKVDDKATNLIAHELNKIANSLDLDFERVDV